MITRLLVDKEGKYFSQHDGKDVSTHFGMIKAVDIAATPDGGEIFSNTRERFIVITPTWLDKYRAIKRGPQIMLLKDLGVIAAETGIGPDSIVGEAGTGSGAGTCYFARIVKHVYSFDVVAEHNELGRKNAEMLGATNITFAIHDVYESIPTPGGEYDLFLLDNPEPWQALKNYRSIKIGGWLVAYIPTILQAAEFVNAVHAMPELQYRKTVELIERHWNIKDRRVRPSSDAVGHTGFLIFTRRIQ